MTEDPSRVFLRAVAVVLACALACAACASKNVAPSPKRPWAQKGSVPVPIEPSLDTPAEPVNPTLRGVSVIPPVPDPEASRQFLESLAQPGLSLSGTTDPPRVTAAALENTALDAAFGMRPEGGIYSVELPEGGRASMPVTIAMGECATFVAQGGLGSVEVDLFLTAAGTPSKILAEDPRSGPIAVIGGNGTCFRIAEKAPFSAELHARMRRGGGVVLVRGYRR